MLIPRIRIANVLCFLLPLSIGLTFPLQVLYGAASVGAASLIILILLFGVSFFQARGMPFVTRHSKRSAGWSWIVLVFAFLSAINIPFSWISFGLEPLTGSIAALFLIVQSTFIFLYFANTATESEINNVFAGMVAMGIVSGAFFVFESVNKIAFGEITEYTRKAHEYSQAAAGLLPGDDSSNRFRISVAYRSFGLLERHATSALWIAMGFFAYSFLTNTLSKRRIAFACTLLALIIAQNFTSIVVFVVISIVVYRRIIGVKSWVVSFLSLTPIVFFIEFDKIAIFFDALYRIMQVQISAAVTVQTELSGYSYFSMILFEVARYGEEIFQRPLQLLLGFGVGTNPFYPTSGDVGFIESIMRLGLPLWLLVTWKILGILKRAVTSDDLAGKSEAKQYGSRLLLASAAILGSIWLMDLHYSTWVHKSICPMLFFGMALACRVERKVTTNSGVELGKAIAGQAYIR